MGQLAADLQALQQQEVICMPADHFAPHPQLLQLVTSLKQAGAWGQLVQQQTHSLQWLRPLEVGCMPVAAFSALHTCPSLRWQLSQSPLPRMAVSAPWTAYHQHCSSCPSLLVQCPLVTSSSCPGSNWCVLGLWLGFLILCPVIAGQGACADRFGYGCRVQGLNVGVGYGCWAQGAKCGCWV